MASQRQARDAGKTNAGKAGASKAGASKAGASKAGPSKAGASKTSASRAGASKTSAGTTGAGRTSASRTGAGPAAQAPVARPAVGVPPASAWLRWTTLVLSIVGLGVSIYLTIEHFSGSNHLAGCSETAGAVNCTKVTTSSQSVVFGIFPVAVLGLAFFVFMVAANSPWAWRWNLPAFRWLRLGSVVIGIGFVLYLVYAELFQIQAICLYCTSVHIITFLLFVLIVVDTTFRQAPKTASALRR
jgi:uncharacterized membrane protein